MWAPLQKRRYLFGGGGGLFTQRDVCGCVWREAADYLAFAISSMRDTGEQEKKKKRKR